jgi:ATP-dependent Clp protease protease subunit
VYPPTIIEKSGRSSKSFDLQTKLLQDRIIYLGQIIDKEFTNSIIMQLLWLNSDNPKETITMFINSPGGDCYDGLAIKDIIDSLACKVNTIGVGMCASMGAYLLAAGTGERKTTKNCRIMVHSVSSYTGGKVQDMKIDYEEFNFIDEKLMSDIAGFTKGKSTHSDIKKLMSRDYYMSPIDAIKIGLIDSIKN